MSTTVTIHQAKTHLSRLLQQVERGKAVGVCRGKSPVAKIVPSGPRRVSRPKVGKAASLRFDIPADAFASLGDEELKRWGPVSRRLCIGGPTLVLSVVGFSLQSSQLLLSQ